MACARDCEADCALGVWMMAITAPWPANIHGDYCHFQSVDAMSSAPSRSAAVGRAVALDLPLGAMLRGSDDVKIE